MTSASFGWTKIIRLGLVQTMLGAIIVLMTSTINRVMVVELALPAVVPGLLVASHYAIQILRPAWGYGSDVGGRRTPWIIGGMAALALGGIGAALGTALAASSRPLGLSVAALSFLLLGIGAGSAGTSVLAMLATHVEPRRRAFAASAVWMMMILGFAISAPLAGSFLDPFSNTRLIAVTSTICAIAFIVATLAVWGVETAPAASKELGPGPPRSRLSDRPWRRYGGSPRRDGSPSSSSFPCSPMALRNCSSNLSPDSSSACRPGRPRSSLACSMAASLSGWSAWRFSLP